MHRFSARSEHGNTLPELLVVLALIAAMASIAVPLLLSYLPSATANYAARELQSGLNRAKLMAVTTRQAVCVQPTASGYRFFQNTTCTGTPWSGAGTDANGVFSLANNITVALAAGSNPIFNQFGVAVQTGTLRVTGQTGSSMTVSVQASGPVTIPRTPRTPPVAQLRGRRRELPDDALGGRRRRCGRASRGRCLGRQRERQDLPQQRQHVGNEGRYGEGGEHPHGRGAHERLPPGNAGRPAAANRVYVHRRDGHPDQGLGGRQRRADTGHRNHGPHVQLLRCE